MQPIEFNDLKAEQQKILPELERSIKGGSLPVAESAARRVLSLPMHPYLTDDELVIITSAKRLVSEEENRSTNS
jgi:dTDP-4-amino-4,6-dideoxygalactose transaminase